MSAVSEVEVLLKMRAEGEKSLDLFSGGLNNVGKSGKVAGEGLEAVGKGSRAAGAGATAAGVAVGLLAERVARGLVGAFKTALNEADKLDAAMIGLGATAKAFGTNAGDAQKAAEKLASDGLMSVGEAASGLKNLLAAGFGLDQAIVLMNRFKDSAAFGRQGSLEFGQAIVGATEGIKNGNSALVDNAGLTKNLSNILVEAGFSAQDLSKVQSDLNVRTALYGGILKETAPQLGQTALYLNTAAGAQAQFNTEITKAQQKIGKELQPVLLGFLSAITPIVQGIGAWSGVLVPLGLAIGAIVGPLAAMRAAAALGIPTFASLGSTLIGGMTAFQGAYTSAGTLRGGLNALGAASGITVKDLGLLKTAALVAGAAFVGWQIGKAIDQLTGASNYVQAAAEKIMGYGTAAETAAAKQDTINRAIAQGARDNIGYSQAVVYNSATLDINRAKIDQSAAAQMKAAEAGLLLGRITREEYEARKAAIAALERHNQVTANRTTLAEALAGSESKIRGEIEKTGLTIPQLTASLKQNEDAFKAWAETHGLSAAAVKFLEEALKKQTDQQKKSKEETEKATAEIEKQRQGLEQLGIVTSVSVNTALAEFHTLEKRAAAEGVNMNGFLRAALPTLQELYQKAVQSGVGIDAAREAFLRAKAATDQFNASIKSIDWAGYSAGLDKALNRKRELIPLTQQATGTTEQLAAAYKHFGIVSKAELSAAATNATFYFNQIKNSGTATPKQIELAHKAMVAAVNAENGKIASHWQDSVVPGVKRQLELLQSAVGGSFAQMLLGAKGFGEGFKDIWSSIKAAALNTFNEIASAFINGALKRMIGAMAGSSNGFASGLGGMLGGGQGGGGSILSSIGGLGAAGGGGAVLPGTAVPGFGAAGAAGGGSGAAGGAGALAGLGAGIGVAGGGLALGMASQKLFGGAGWKSAGAGALAGAAQGALIGSVVPVLGTAVGAIVGGLAGAVGGWLGKKQGQKVNDVRDQFVGQFGGSGTGAGSGFGELAAQLHAVGEGGDAIFQRLIQTDKMKDFEQAVKDAVAALEAHRAKEAEAAAATEANTDAHVASLEEVKAQLAAIEAQELALTSARATQSAEDQKLTDQALENLKQKKEAALEELQGLERLDVQIDEGAKTWRRYAEAGGIVGPKLKEAFRAAVEAARAAGQDIDSVIRGLFDEGIVIPITYSVPDLPNAPQDTGQGEQTPGGAAAGIYANRPTLAVFGEGGEPELGGPKSFFSDVFRALGVGTNGNSDQGGGGAAVPAFHFNVTTLDADGLRSAVEREVIPMILDALRANRRGSRTDFRAALSVG